jgi:hypothetical protein
MKFAILLAFTTFGILTASPVMAQDAHAGHDMAAMNGAVAELPPICLGGEDHAMGDASMDHEMDSAHADLMAGMDENNALMMRAGMAEDIDVAFMCAMIPHHQSAINMARAELAHGDDEQARSLAEDIIAAQEAEIAEMREWLEGQATP